MRVVDSNCFFYALDKLRHVSSYAVYLMSRLCRVTGDCRCNASVIGTLLKLATELRKICCLILIYETTPQAGLSTS